jgi:hypothetical protein
MLPGFLRVPGNKFLSLEPLLERVDLTGGRDHEDIGDIRRQEAPSASDLGGISWVVVGPETGMHHRPCDPEWIRLIIRHCRASSVPVWVKALNIDGRITKDMAEWPEDLRVRETPWHPSSPSV